MDSALITTIPQVGKIRAFYRSLDESMAGIEDNRSQVTLFDLRVPSGFRVLTMLTGFGSSNNTGFGSANNTTGGGLFGGTSNNTGGFGSGGK